MKTKTWPAPLAALALIVVAGCGGDDNSGSTSSASGNKTDAAFITDMTTHHQGAIDMAKLAQKKADHAEIRTLADGIISAQQGEIESMKTIQGDLRSTGAHDGGHMGMSRHAMGMDTDMDELGHATPFDKAFIDAMVAHHQGAIVMAEELLEKGEHPALRTMADDVIRAQTEEIAQMKQWRKDWYGSANVPTP